MILFLVIMIFFALIYVVVLCWEEIGRYAILYVVIAVYYVVLIIFLSNDTIVRHKPTVGLQIESPNQIWISKSYS